LNFNGDTNGNYTDHQLYGDGSSAVAITDGASLTTIYMQKVSSRTGNTNVFGAAILDVLDYASVNKYKTVRYLAGVEANTTSTQFRSILGSGLWMSNTAITSLTLTGDFSIAQYSSFALYGVR
jgi:hypothetical protein